MTVAVTIHDLARMTGLNASTVSRALRNDRRVKPATRERIQELARRKAAWVCPEPKVKTGYLARYAKMVSSADKGAILE